MISNLYFGIPKKIRIFVIFLLIMFTIYFIGQFLFAKIRTIPQDFLKARQEASLVAQVIVKLSEESAVEIEKISDLSKAGDYTAALNLVVKEMEHNRDIRQKAMSLSSNLEAMTRASLGIHPDSSARLALEAVSVETTLISRLINYSDYLNQLLEILRAKLLGKSDSQEKINELISKINTEAKAVNELNKKFNDLISNFDNQEINK